MKAAVNIGQGILVVAGFAFVLAFGYAIVVGLIVIMMAYAMAASVGAWWRLGRGMLLEARR